MRRATPIVAGVLRRGGRVLICQRAGGRHAGQWEFPGGKVEAGESEPAALARELREELGIEAEVRGLLLRLRHNYGDGELDLAFYEADIVAGEPENRVFAAIAWERADALAAYPFLEADRPLLRRLAGEC